MKRLFFFFVISFLYSVSLMAQSKVFDTTIYNKEYGVAMRINLYEESVTIPGQSVLGGVYGFLQKGTDSRVWIVMGVKFSKDGKSARLDMINDYGSEDLVTELSLKEPGVYVLRHLEGSPIKVAGKSKWIKLPKTLTFTTSPK